MTITAGPSLSDEMRAVEHDNPGWHLFASDAGRIWASTNRKSAGGCGTTLDAETPQAMRYEIARQVREWAVAA